MVNFLSCRSLAGVRELLVSVILTATSGKWREGEYK